MFSLLVLSIFVYEAQGIRLQKLGIPVGNHQELITKSSSSNQDDDGSAMATKLSSGINRKLMTKIKPSSFTTTNDKNNEKHPITVTRERVVKETTFSTTHEKTQVNFMYVTDYNLWKSVTDGASIPMVPATEAGGASVPKDVTRYIDVELKLRDRDMRALGLLIMMCEGNVEMKNNRMKMLKRNTTPLVIFPEKIAQHSSIDM
ncbi:hypothetical protein L1987_01531 [Smallanthus sonchifolius]|uniref:Uncharacterized protein n=1 Tax=Smallanthus sonchifolius TaxID=185202 RepID=A0ACB9K5G8_9ASTR|nr:hypothetical protein L1987_01531 [Smallanthus sonchifolius]